MKTLLNIIWLVLAGFWLAIGYVLAGILCCILIITIPFGIRLRSHRRLLAADGVGEIGRASCRERVSSVV